MQFKIQSTLEDLSDQELVANFGDLVADERENLVRQLEVLIEMDRRKLTYEYPSLWAFLINEKGVDEATAERRIRAARLMKKFPELKAMLESGKMNLSLVEIALSCAHREELSDPELLEVLKAISGMSCRKAKRELAERYPESVEIPRDRVRPFHSGFSEVTFYADEELMGKLEEIRGLLATSHSGTRGIQMRDLIKVLADQFYERNHPEPKARRAEERAKEREGKMKTREESPSAPRVGVGAETVASNEIVQTGIQNLEQDLVNGVTQNLVQGVAQEIAYDLDHDIEVPTRTHSQPIVHAMVLKNGYCCSYIDPVTGRKCQSTYNLQKDHIQSWFSGGKTSLSNARFACAHHHRRISYLEFGDLSKFEKK